MPTFHIPHPAESMILAKVPEKVIDLSKVVQLAVFDVDGILTDGGLWFTENGEHLKRFNVLDGHGLRLLETHGVKVAFITGRSSAILTRRAAELGIAIVKQGCNNKKQALLELADELNIDLAHIAFMGDDIIDLSAMQTAGLAIAVPNAPNYIQQAAHWVTQQSGGNGAVREFCDMVLAAKGLLGAVLTQKHQLPTQHAIQ
ncbi:KdsC family phosphatase [Brackiella oedipodis]|uniref:KdsC family phosphatase n=1 Tax=Brackiella oedipodis TaxID=124225 RepID=UPI00048DC238|nr:HAD-IIIA family hydrolase [Brackiella oedipodis]